MNIGFRWFMFCLFCLLCLRVPWGRTKKGSSVWVPRGCNRMKRRCCEISLQIHSIFFLLILFKWYGLCDKICKLIFSHQKNISNDYRRISEWLPKDYWHIIMSPFRPFGLQIDDSCGFVIKITLRHEEIIALWSIFIRVFFLVCYLWKFRLVPSFCNFLNKMNDFLSFHGLFISSSFDIICVALYLLKSAKMDKW